MNQADKEHFRKIQQQLRNLFLARNLFENTNLFNLTCLKLQKKEIFFTFFAYIV